MVLASPTCVSVPEIHVQAGMMKRVVCYPHHNLFLAAITGDEKVNSVGCPYLDQCC